MKYFFKTLIIFCTVMTSAHAIGPIYGDVHASAGYGKAEVENASSAPNMMQYGLGATLGWQFSILYLGASADYYKVAQLTEPNTSFGNRGGTRTNIASPTIGIRLPFFKFKFDYQMLGTYEYEKKTSSGNTLKYEDPSGYRAYIGVPFFPFMELGAFYESVSYEKEINGSTERTLTNKLNISQYGLMAAFVF